MPVYKVAYDLLIDVLDIGKNVDKRYSVPLTNRMKEISYQIAYNVRIIYDIKDREALIESTQASCRELAFILQILCDKKQFSKKKFALESERIVSVSKQLDGLRRTVKA